MLSLCHGFFALPKASHLFKQRLPTGLKNNQARHDVIAYNSDTWEVKIGGLPRVQCQPGLHSKTLVSKTNKNVNQSTHQLSRPVPLNTTTVTSPFHGAGICHLGTRGKRQTGARGLYKIQEHLVYQTQA